MRRTLFAFLGLLAAGPASVLAASVAYDPPEVTATLPPGPHHDMAEGMCAACHSVDYISTQPPMPDPRAFWTAEVTKMRHVYGAPIDDEAAKEIIDYLVATYGK